MLARSPPRILSWVFAAGVGLILVATILLGKLHPTTDVLQPKLEPQQSPTLDRRPAEDTQIITLPRYQNTHLSPPIDPTFAAFAFEERSFLYYANQGALKDQGGRANAFSQNLINDVAKRTKVVPVIRVGGTSLDYSSYDPEQEKAVMYPPGQQEKNVPINLTIGPSWFKTFQNLPDAQYIFTVPLATKNLSNMIEYTKAGAEAISTAGSSLLSISVGNEPNLYQGRARSENFTVGDWVEQFKRWTLAISDALDQDRDLPFFDAEGLAGGPKAIPSLPSWSQRRLFREGLEEVRSKIKSVSMHYYQTNSHGNPSVQNVMMNHTQTVHGCRYFRMAAQFLRAKRIELNLAEVGSALDRGGNAQELEGSFAATLWQVDFMLYCMTIGINRINYQQGIGFSFSMWQPTSYRGLPAHVRPPYYAQVFVADFIGTSASGNGKFEVTNIDMKQDFFTAYAGYENEVLTRAVLVNLMEWNRTMGDRPRTAITLKLPSGARGVTIRRLTSSEGAGARDASEITWDCEQWTFQSNGKGVKVCDHVETLNLWHNTAEFDVYASEAVAVSFDY